MRKYLLGLLLVLLIGQFAFAENTKVFQSMEKANDLIALDEIPTSVNPNIKENDILQTKTYPNPTSDFITFEFKNISSAHSNLQIINTQGQIIKQYTYKKM